MSEWVNELHLIVSSTFSSPVEYKLLEEHDYVYVVLHYTSIPRSKIVHGIR